MADRTGQGPSAPSRGPVCPVCGKPSEGREGEGRGRFYPFCSERCRLVDLGRWLDGVYQIPAESPAVDGGEPAPGTATERPD